MDAFSTPECCNHCPGHVVCHCLQINEATVVEMISRLELRTLKEIRCHTGAGDGCTACHDRLRQLLEQYGYSSSPIFSCK